MATEPNKMIREVFTENTKPGSWWSFWQRSTAARRPFATTPTLASLFHKSTQKLLQLGKYLDNNTIFVILTLYTTNRGEKKYPWSGVYTTAVQI